MTRSRGHKTAFIIELTALFMAIVVATLVFSGVFAMCRSRSDKASMLNDSVILAVNAAELASASSDIESLQTALASPDNIIGHTSRYIGGDDSSSGAVMVLAAAESGSRNYIVKVSRHTEENGTYTSDVIDVFDAGKAAALGDIEAASLTKPVYTLETGSRHGKEAGA